ncbi:MAG: hypothetical protein Q4A55_05545 [Aerococcus sp.]|nr:hypothetical protein [Aerococcus sp.]
MLIDPCFSGLSPQHPLEKEAWFTWANQLVQQGVTHALVAPCCPLDPTFPSAMDDLVLEYQTLLDRRGIPLCLFASQLVDVEASPHQHYTTDQLLFADLNQRYVLAAIHPTTPFEALYPLLFEWLKDDIRPVLVGMETSEVMSANDQEHLFSQGCYFLVSSQSVMGLNGNRAKQAAWRALGQGQVQLIGSTATEPDGTHFTEALSAIRKRFGTSYGDDLLLNAKALVNGDPLITQFQLPKTRWRWPFSR